MAKTVSNTERKPRFNACLIGVSFRRFQSVKKSTRYFSDANTATKPANAARPTCCIPDPDGLSPRSQILRIERPPVPLTGSSTQLRHESAHLLPAVADGEKGGIPAAT